MSVQVKERPILFSGEMVRALLDGRKTQTRRMLKPQPILVDVRTWDWEKDRNNGASWSHLLTDPVGILQHSPYGKPGDRLWVKEDHYRYGHWDHVPGVKTKTGRMKWRFVADTSQVLYGEDLARLQEVYGAKGVRGGRHHKDPATAAWHKRLGRFMPRAARRITLEITEVRVLRLQEISVEDAIAEGFGSAFGPGCFSRAFDSYWNELHGSGAWEGNPWVWAVSFKRVQQ